MGTLNKLTNIHGIKQRQTPVKEVKGFRLTSRHFRYAEPREKAAPETPCHRADHWSLERQLSTFKKLAQRR